MATGTAAFPITWGGSATWQPSGSLSSASPGRAVHVRPGTPVPAASSSPTTSSSRCGSPGTCRGGIRRWQRKHQCGSTKVRVEKLDSFASCGVANRCHISEAGEDASRLSCVFGSSCSSSRLAFRHGSLMGEVSMTVPRGASVQGQGGDRQRAKVVFVDEGSVVCAASLSGSSHNPKSDHRVLVIGGTGGVGQLLVAGLLRQGYKVRALIRSKEKGDKLFGGDHDGDRLQICYGDLRFTDTWPSSVFDGISYVAITVGTTAFPSKRWDGDNGPERTDYDGVRNLIDVVPPTVKKMVMVSSVGIERKESFPWNIMNMFGVLTYKKMAEDYVRQCGLPYTIIRAGRLTGGPYTSYDLNTLLKATEGDRKAVILEHGDRLSGEVSRITVAEACIQALQIECTAGHTYAINSVKGDGPGSDVQRWQTLFEEAPSKNL